MNETLRHASRISLQDYYLGTVGNADVYQVPAGWEKEVLKEDADVTTVQNAEAFEKAVATAHVTSVFVPQSAGIAQPLAEAILERHQTETTIYWETAEAK